MPKIATVTGKLAGGKRPARKPGHQPMPLTSTMAPKTTYSSTKTVRKTRRKLEIRRACHIAPARTNPVLASPTVPGSPASSPTAKAMAANTAARIARIRNLSCSAIKRVSVGREQGAGPAPGGLPESKVHKRVPLRRNRPWDAGDGALSRPARGRLHGDVSRDWSVPDLHRPKFLRG